jgi:hypothetical protein
MSDYFSQLVSEASKSIPSEERIPKHFEPVIRRSACERLTRYMRSMRPFSFLRLGDMELGLMLADQAKQEIKWTELPENQSISSGFAFGHPGLDTSYTARLKRSYENATYVDFHERWWINRALNPLLTLQRKAGALRNSDESDSHIFFEWLQYSFKDYISNRRCLFAGAEAGILGELYRRDEYKIFSKDYWPDSVVPFFQAEESLLVNQLDEIKQRISKTIQSENIDTLFLSLGGGAKIICSELAQELGICAFDFGGLMRGLTYSGSDGHAFVRATHHPFFFRIPFDLYMDAYESSHPNIEPEKLLVKAQCQVLMELSDHKVGESVPSGSGYTNIISNNFNEALKRYRSRYDKLIKLNKKTKFLGRQFHLRCVEEMHGKNSLKFVMCRIRSRLERMISDFI